MTTYLEFNNDRTRKVAWSDDRRHRYALTIDLDVPLVMLASPKPFVSCGLNPSDADAFDDDPTIRIEKGIAIRLGYNRLVKVNLFGLVSSNPKRLKQALDPVGPDNDAAIIAAAELDAPFIVSWGAFLGARERAKEVLQMLGRSVSCYGVNGDGSPWHPLRHPLITTLGRYFPP